MTLSQMPAYAQANGIELGSMDEVIADADFLSLHLPLTPETRGLVNDCISGEDEKGILPDQHRPRRGCG